MHRLSILLLLLAASCHTRAHSRTDAALPLPLSLRIDEAACNGLCDCQIERVHQGLGKTADGRDLVIAIVHSGTKRNKPRRDCVRYETWLISTSNVDAKRVQLLADRCARRVPRILELAPNRIAYAEHDETSSPTEDLGVFEWNAYYEIALQPLRFLRKTTGRGPHGAAPHRVSVPGRLIETCSTGGDCDHPLPTLRSIGVSIGSEWEAFARGDWKTTRLGECGTVFVGPPSNAIVDPPGEATASVRALLEQDTLYLEIYDDVFVTQGPRVDRLTMELADGEFPWEADVWKLTMDGSLFVEDPFGHMKERKNAEMASDGPHIRRFRIRHVLRPGQDNAQFRYDDTDDGRSSRKLATDYQGGPIERVLPGTARCMNRDGALQLEMGKEWEPGPDEPLIETLL